MSSLEVARRRQKQTGCKCAAVSRERVVEKAVRLVTDQPHQHCPGGAPRCATPLKLCLKGACAACSCACLHCRLSEHMKHVLVKKYYQNQRIGWSLHTVLAPRTCGREFKGRAHFKTLAKKQELVCSAAVNILGQPHKLEFAQRG